MKTINIILVIVIAGLFNISCGDNPNEPTGTGEKRENITAKNYFPGGIGSTFDYILTSIDTSTMASTQFATVNSEIKFSSFNVDTLFSMNNKFNFAGLGNLDLNYKFRRTDFGIYFQVDSAAVLGMLGIPDSLIPPDAELQIDKEINVFSFPLFEDKFWFAFQANIVVGGVAYIPVISINAQYAGQEQLTVPAFESAKTAEKIKYTTTLVIPDFSDSTRTSFDTRKFIAYAWFVQNVGLAKFESDPSLVQVLASNFGIASDSTTIIIENLTAYDLK